jgi:phage tail sheath gpL-like
VIANVTFTAKTSGATGNQFNISTTPAPQATNMAAAINASASLAGIVTAEANGAVVTIYAELPGNMGNGLQISENLSNVALSSFATEDDGDDGTEYELAFD